MKAITSVNIRKNQSATGTATRKIAQCCAKSSKLVAGCHD